MIKCYILMARVTYFIKTCLRCRQWFAAALTLLTLVLHFLFLLKLCLDKRPMPNDNSKAAWPEWNWQFILFRHWDRNSRLWHGGSLSIFFLLQRTSHRCLPLYRPREFYTIINLNSGLKRYCLKAAVFQSLVRHLPVFAPLLGGSEVRNPSPF